MMPFTTITLSDLQQTLTPILPAEVSSLAMYLKDTSPLKWYMEDSSLISVVGDAIQEENGMCFIDLISP